MSKRSQFVLSRKVMFIISDLHLGEGWQTHWEYNLEAFDYDLVFKHFIEMIIEKYANTQTEVTLIFNGDTFDPLAVLYKGKSIAIPFEAVDRYKMQRIIQGHPYVFDALERFLSHKHFNLKIIFGNHDLFLYWPSVQQLLIRRLGKEYAHKIFFAANILENDIYISHGNTEYHSQTPTNPIVEELTLVPFKRGWLKKLILNGELFKEKKVLDIPLGHYLITALQNPLKKYNLLIGHMCHHHGFVWLNAVFGIGRKTWYRRHRLFAVMAILMGIWIMIKFWWYRGSVRIVKKILQVLWWTITGVLEGQAPRDEAKRLLEKDDIGVVVFGHDHTACYETIKIGGKNKLYINSGTWQLMREVKVEPIEIRWKYFQRWERICKRMKRFLSKLFNPIIEDITEFPVVRIRYSTDGNREIKLMRFNDQKRDLEEFV